MTKIPAGETVNRAAHNTRPAQDRAGSADIVLATINAKWIHPSLALRLLAANLGNLESRCLILEFALRQNDSEKIEAILAARPRVLGLSVSIWNHRATLALLAALRQKWQGSPRPWIVLGGPEVSWLAGDAEIFRYADYVVRGEGEGAFRELCEKLLAPGSRGSAGEAAPANFINTAAPDISGLASPYGLYTDEDLRRRLIYVESSRGCAFHCDFCMSAKHDGGKPVRDFPLEPFFAEMEKLLDRVPALETERTRTIKFLDRSFNIDPARAVAILDFFLDRIKNKNQNLCVHFEMVPFLFSTELLDLLARFPAGSLRLELGIQTLNPAVAARINRTGDGGVALEVLNVLREKTAAIIHADLIAGLPGEDIASFGDGFDRLWMALTNSLLAGGLLADDSRAAAASPFFEIQPGILKLLPGSNLARHTEPYAMKYSREPPYEVIETAAVPAAEMNRLKNFARFWEIIVNRNHFPGETARLVPPGAPVFWRFMELSDKLLGAFGKNWGIDRNALREVLADYRLVSLGDCP